MVVRRSPGQLVRDRVTDTEKLLLWNGSSRFKEIALMVRTAENPCEMGLVIINQVAILFRRSSKGMLTLPTLLYEEIHKITISFDSLEAVSVLFRQFPFESTLLWMELYSVKWISVINLHYHKIIIKTNISFSLISVINV